MIFKHEVTITTDASGDATVYSGVVRGVVKAITYVPGTIVTGGDLTITAENSGLAIVTITNAGTSTVTWHPRALASKVADGSDATDAFTELPLFDERIKCVVAQGGATKTGTINFYTEE